MSSDPGWTASPICSDFIFDRHRGSITTPIYSGYNKLLYKYAMIDGRMKISGFIDAVTEHSLCVPKIRFGVDAAGGRRKLAS